MRLAFALPLLLGASVALAQSDPDALGWLQRIYTATQKLSYTGTFVYQRGNQVETSRITRIVDAKGARERLETLDGIPREIIRNGDEVLCYLPGTMTVKIDKQVGATEYPSIFPGNVGELAEHYDVRKGDVERVAGFDCRVLVLEPRDKLRYGHKLWADLASGMLVKAKTLNERNVALEQFAFTELKIGGHINRERVKSRFKARGHDWRVEDARAVEANLAQSGWTIRSAPPGFRKVMEMTRTLGGRPGVGHIVFSDGLAAVSVFIEPAKSSGAHTPGLAHQGIINVYTRQLADHWITVLGETPAESVRLIANAVEYRKPR